MKRSSRLTLRAQGPVAVEVDAPFVGPFVEQIGANVLLPAATVLDREVHMLGGAGAVFEPAQKGSIAISYEFRRVRFFHDLVTGIDIGHQVDDAVVRRRDLATGPAHIQAKMIAHHFGLSEVSLRRPPLGRFLPENLKQADAVHRLMLQDAIKPLLARQFH